MRGITVRISISRPLAVQVICILLIFWLCTR